MTVEKAVRQHLVADSGVIALAGTRGYQMRLPQAPTLPAFRVQLIDESEHGHLRGGGATRLARVQVDAVAGESSGVNAYADASALADAINDAMMTQAPFVVSDGGSPATSLELKVVERPTRMAMYDPQEVSQVRIIQDYMIWSRTVN